MDENELYEQKREEILQSLKTAYVEVKDKLTPEERKVFERIIESLSLISTGVDAAHRRIRVRKQEFERLDKSLHRLAKSQASLIEAIRLFANVQKKDSEELKKEFDKLSKNNSRFMKIVVVSFLIVTALLTYLAQGSQNMLSMLDGMSTLLKTINVIM